MGKTYKKSHFDDYEESEYEDYGRRKVENIRQKRKQKQDRMNHLGYDEDEEGGHYRER